MRTLVKRHSLLAYFVLAFAGFWSCLALGYVNRFHFWVPILGVFAPAVAALVIAGIVAGENGVRRLVRRLGIWRVGLIWYAVAFGLPLARALIAVGVAALWGKSKGIKTETLAPVLPAIWWVFLFAAGEELAWRGYALPRLLARHNAVYASLILGMLHAVWHWPLILLPRQFMSDASVWSFTTFVLAQAIVITWIFLNTRGSVLLVAIYHGMSNAVNLLYEGIDRAWLKRFPMDPALSVLLALIVILATGSSLARKQARRGEGASATG
jgi:membrane protease YdiL (CAAX protease family)